MGDAAVFLQVRIASSRLRNKALLPLGGKPVIVHAMEALKRVDVDQHWIVTDSESVPYLEEPAQKSGFRLFAGDPTNVLKRFCDAARTLNVETIVRATGDNPLVSATIANRALKLYEESDADYAGIVDSPFGTGVEVLRSSALCDLLSRSGDPYEQEHVGPGLYRDPDRYRVVIRAAEPSFNYAGLRVTLDTAQDYHQLKEIYRSLYRGVPIEIPELIVFAREQMQHSA